MACDCIGCALAAVLAERYPNGPAGMSDQDKNEVLVAAADCAAQILASESQGSLFRFLAVTAAKVQAGQASGGATKVRH